MEREIEMIPIVLAADNNYSTPLKVLIGSILLASKPESGCEIIIITDEIMEAETLEQFKSKFPAFRIRFIRINNKILKNAKIYNEGLSIFTYCRLLIPQLLKDYDKCIYIDTDALVLDDLADLPVSLAEHFYLAGVKDYGLQTTNYGARLKEMLNIPSMEKYVNAGVLLMNLQEMRNAGLSELFMQDIGKEWIFEDQDIINKCCCEKINFLPVRYNVLYRYYKRGKCWNIGFYPPKDVKMAQENPAIIHFTGRDMKPWKFIRGRASVLWWKAARKILTESEFKDIYEKAQEFDEKMQWKYIVNHCQNKKVIIWGAFALGKELLYWLRNAKISVQYFGDNDIKKSGMQIDGLEVKTLEAFHSEIDLNDYLFIIASQKHYEAIEMQLKQNGIYNIVRYFHKTEFYYLALDDKYFEEELKEIQDKEKVYYKNFPVYIQRKYWMDKWIYWNAGSN